MTQEEREALIQELEADHQAIVGRTQPNNTPMSERDALIQELEEDHQANMARMSGKKPNKQEELARNQYAEMGKRNNTSVWKNFAKGIGAGTIEMSDLPQMLATLGEKALLQPEDWGIGQLRKLYHSATGQEHQPWEGVNVTDNWPESYVSGKIKGGIKDVTGLDIEPDSSTLGNRVAGHAGKFAGSFLPFNRVAKGLQEAGKTRQAANYLGKTANAAAIGATSGIAQEAGVNPLLADVGASLLLPLPYTTYNKVFKYPLSRENQEGLGKQVAKKTLTNTIGEEDVPKTLEAIDKYYATPKPIDIALSTPEVTQNAALARLVRSKTNDDLIPRLHEQYKSTDSILRSELNKLGLTGIAPFDRGAMLRNPVATKLEKLEAKRAENAIAPYKKLEESKKRHDPLITKKLVRKEIMQSPEGETKNMLRQIRRSLSRPGSKKPDLTAVQGADNTAAIQALQKQLDNIDRQYAQAVNFDEQALSHPVLQKAIADEKAPLLAEMSKFEASAPAPKKPKKPGLLPIQLDKAIRQISGKINKAKKSGDSAKANLLSRIKASLEEDLIGTDVGNAHRKIYHRDSVPISELKDSQLIRDLLKKEKGVEGLSAYKLPNEKVPNKFFNSSLVDLDHYLKQNSSNPTIPNLLKGLYIDELLAKSTLSSGNTSPDKVTKFLKSQQNDPRIKRLFTPEERRKVDFFRKTIQDRNRVEELANMRNSNTHQKGIVYDQYTKAAEEARKHIGSGLTYLAGQIPIVGKPLQAGVHYGRRALGKKPLLIDDNKVVNDAILNPHYYKEIMQYEHKPKGFWELYNNDYAKAALLRGGKQ